MTSAKQILHLSLVNGKWEQSGELEADLPHFWSLGNSWRILEHVQAHGGGDRLGIFSKV